MSMLTPKCSEWEKTPYRTHLQEISEHQRKKKNFLEIPREKNNKKILFKGLKFRLVTDDLKWSNNLMFKDKTTFNLEFYFQ